MPIKYTRDGFQSSALRTQNRYERPSRFGGSNPRKRLIFIYLGLVFMGLLTLVYHFAAQRVDFGWLPERQGIGIVLEKRIEDEESPNQKHMIVVKVFVPPAGESEAKLIPMDRAGRAKIIGALEFTKNVHTPEPDWQAVEPGTSLTISYRIDPKRTKIIVQGLSVEEAPLDTDGDTP